MTQRVEAIRLPVSIRQTTSDDATVEIAEWPCALDHDDYEGSAC